MPKSTNTMKDKKKSKKSSKEGHPSQSGRSQENTRRTYRPLRENYPNYGLRPLIFTDSDKEELERSYKNLITSDQYKRQKELLLRETTQHSLNMRESTPFLLYEDEEKRTNTQIRSFTKWVNKQLEKGNFPLISSVVEDFADGKSLLNLISVLFPHEIKRNCGELNHFQIRDNIAHAIKIVESYNIDLVNIDADGIINKNTKLTLGLTWSLILRCISSFIDNTDSNFKTVLLNWCRECTKNYGNVNITDFSTSWKNGLAFNAILHHYGPSFDYNSLSPTNDHHNLTHAFNLAENTFKIAPLLDVTDLTENIYPDEKSIITYLSDYYLKLECLDFKSQLEKGKEYMSNVNSHISECIASYDKLYYQIQAAIQEKIAIQEQMSDLVDKHDSADKEICFDQKMMRLSAMYGDLQTAYPLFRSKEFVTENMPVKLFKMYLNTLIRYVKEMYLEYSSNQTQDPYYGQVKRQMDDLKNHLKLLSTKVSYEEDKVGVCLGRENELFHNCLMILKEKQERTTSKSIYDLYSEKIRFLTSLAQHKKFANYRVNTAKKLFQTYDTKQRGYIFASDMKNCCVVLDIPVPEEIVNTNDAVERDSKESEITFNNSAYLEYVESEFAKQEKDSLTVADEVCTSEE